MRLQSTLKTVRSPLTVRRTLLSMLGTALLLSAGVAQAALQSRDLNGDTVTDAFYDTDLNITWLRDANINGAKTWSAAVNWAANYAFGGYSDWRLPTSDNCYGLNCSGSEMGHLWYVEWGNTGIPTNIDGFQNVREAGYWSGTVNPGNPTDALFFQMQNGFQNTGDHANKFRAFAVRDGDVAAVPEPESYALMLAGLAAVSLAARRRSRHS